MTLQMSCQEYHEHIVSVLFFLLWFDVHMHSGLEVWRILNVTPTGTRCCAIHCS